MILSSAVCFCSSVFTAYGNCTNRLRFPDPTSSSIPSINANLRISLCIVELCSFITEYSGFSIIATFALLTVTSFLLPSLSSYNSILTDLGYHWVIRPVLSDSMSYPPVTSGFRSVSTGTTATTPSSSIDKTTSCMKALPD